MTTRTKRTSKVVNYSTIENGSYSDDDFADFTPPSKKKKEKSRKQDRNKENETSSANDKIGETLVNVTSSKKKSPKNRISVEERTFQRDLQLAMEMSSKPKGVKDECQSFDGSEPKEDSLSESESTLNVSVAAAEVHSVPESISETNNVTSVDEGKDVQEKLNAPAQDDEPVPGTSDGLTSKRLRKKVNFVEDDSDGWSDHENETESDSDASEFAPSPCKKKTKKTSKTQATKSPKEKKAVRKPLKTKQETTVTKTIIPTSVTPQSNNTNSNTKPKSAKTHQDDVVSYIPKPTASAYTTNSPSVGLVKKPFKSPTVESLSPNTPIYSRSLSSTPSRNTSSPIGLRLGLSRRGVSKPLHPNASVK